MPLFWLLVVTVWLGIFGCWWMISGARKSSDYERVKERIVGLPERNRKSAKPPALLSDKVTPQGTLLPRLLQKLNLRGRAELLIEQAGLTWSPERPTQVSLALFLCGFSGAWYLAPKVRGLALAAGALAAALPLLWILRKRQRRLLAFEEVFPDSLEFIGRSMRAGHAFSVALDMVHREFNDPLATEFRRTSEEHNLGMPLEVALGKLGQRVPSMDVRFFISAVVLQKRTGGNLAELLDKLASLIRDRFKLRGRIRAVAAHGKMTGLALSLIPVGVGAMMLLVNRDYLTFFSSDELGQTMIGGAVVIQLIGYGIIRKIVNIEA